MEKYEKSGCNECVHNTSKYDFIDGKFTLIERKCLLGNTDKLIKWWNNNGTKTDKNLEKMDCHEYNQSTRNLIDMNKKTSELSELLEKLQKVTNK